MSEEDKLQNDILLYYCENIRPLLLELKLRRGDDHLLGINNEIRALNDHIARCYSENITSQQRMEQLSKAEGHVRRLILDCFKQLNMDLFSKFIFFAAWHIDYESLIILIDLSASVN